jgi:hypothetical protein
MEILNEMLQEFTAFVNELGTVLRQQDEGTVVIGTVEHHQAFFLVLGGSGIDMVDVDAVLCQGLGKAKGFERKYNMALHVFRTPQEKKHWGVGGVWEAPWRLADDYHVYGLEWNEDEIKYFVDGVLVRSVENTHWHQPLFLIFDSETMPKWFGMPDDKDLPSTFSVEYVRAWKKK